MTTSPNAARRSRSSPTPRPGAKEFPDSNAAALQLLHAAEAQAVPLRGRHRRGPARPAALPEPGLALRVLRRPRRATRWTGPPSRRGAVDRGEPGALPGVAAARATTGRPTAGTSSATPTRSGSSRSTATTPTSCGRSTRTSRPPARPRPSSSGTANWVTFVERNVGAWMHVEHGLGLYLFANAQPPGTDEHAQQRDLGEQHAPDPLRPGPGAVQPHAQRGDRGLRRRCARRDLEQRPGLAGRPRVAEQLTGIDDWARRSSPPTSSSSRWSASCSAASSCSRRHRATATS